ncbi:SDR family NAD(P)-dependent oxidoreductase [uncultured Devosia sp.]|uniref:SDR family NAD(P)-dependent oxidoreductase n=1 Tax=uncultured Devosia sp. TaxID=211434 RepID=UPI0035C96F07
MSFKLAQQSVIVTGAAQGLGAAIARRFAQEGARLALLDYNAASLADTAQACGSKAMPIEVDLSSADDTDRAIAQALAQLGTVDTLIHNAAILDRRLFVDETFASFTRTLNVGLQAGFQLAHAVWPGMAAQGGGAIVFVSSRSGIEGFVEEAAYCASKHALEGLAKSLAMEGQPHGITANTISPGMYMRTPMSDRNYNEDLKSKWVDPMLLTSAFVSLAERRDPASSGQRIDAWALSRQIDGR